ncbi:MAG: efflux RND transporter periplasmic adaptor subunit [Prolixibacteraceae bacterium]|nr:efflux RND transporter periplasmic adaptor subunit [Prolixibacteraceae bacterium]
MDKIIEKKKGIQKKHIFWGLGILIIGFLIVKLAFGDHSSVFRAEKDKLTVSNVEDGIFNDYITVIGQVEPITTIFLDAVEGGTVEERFIEEGAIVKKGDVILRLENRQLYQTILNSEAALAEKENYLRNTRISFETELIQSKRNILDSEYKLTRKKRTFNQYETLYKEALISKEDYLQAKEDYEYESNLLVINKLKARNDSIMRATSMITLVSDLGKMRQMLDLVHERLDDLNVKAPVDGQLGMLDAEIGQSISGGQRIGQVNVLDNFKVNAKIDEHYIDRIVRGLAASLDRNGTNFSLIVKKVYPDVREGQFKIDLVFEGQTPENVRTGQTYHVKLELGESQKALMIPRGGFFQSTGGQWVFVLNDAGTEAVKRQIKIGKQNPQYYEVLEGLNAGEKVITSGYEMFGTNDKITFR